MDYLLSNESLSVVLFKMNISKTGSIALIILSGICSWIIANAWVDDDTMELGALVNFLVPQMIAAALLVLFLLVDWLAPKIRLYSVAAAIIVNLWTGIQ